MDDNLTDLSQYRQQKAQPDVPQLQAIALGLGFPMEWFYQPPVQGWPGIENTSLRWH